MSAMVITRLPRLSLPIKLTIVGASISVALIGALAIIFRRKRKKVPPPYINIVDETDNKVASNHMNHLASSRVKRAHPPKSPTHGKSPNGDINMGRRSWSPIVQRLSRSGSTASLRSDAASSSTLTLGPLIDTDALSAAQLCDLGLESLQSAIKHWEEAIERIDELEEDDTNPDLESLQDQLHHLICRAYHMRDHYEQRLFRQVSTTAALDAAIQEMDKEYEQQKRRSAASLTESSDQDSFVSALEVADLSDLDLQRKSHHDLALYEAALLELTHGSIPCRALRTREVLCSSDTEFLAKLHCIRLAFDEWNHIFQDIFSDEAVRQWFMDMGRQIISDLLVKADRDPEEFQAAYDDMMSYLNDATNWLKMEDELKGRGVKVMSFYDIVIDFLLFDAFDDLDNPPSSVRTVIQNRWLSNGFKETALATAVWSVLKAKKRMLKYSKGFIAHFYAISEHVSPVLAWGFLGPSDDLKDICFFFRDQVLGFMRDVFSFEHSRYTVVEQLSEDILRMARHYVEVTSVRLSS